MIVGEDKMAKRAKTKKTNWVFDFSGNGSAVGAGLSYGFEDEFTPNRD